VRVSVGGGVLVGMNVFVGVGSKVGVSEATASGWGALTELPQLGVSKQTRTRINRTLVCMNFPFAGL
jgi:hypothetical protein